MPVQIRKIVAASVLIWAFADLSVPGLCQADDNKIGATDSLIVVVSQGKHSPALSRAGIPTPAPYGYPDECFCCSPYASPTSVFNHHAAANPGVTAACSVAAIVVSFSLSMATQQLAPVERRRSHFVPPDNLPAPLRC